MNMQGDNHIFKRFDDEMKHLHGLVVEMGKLAVSQLKEAVETLQNEDAQVAARVIKQDSKLNAYDIAADQEITRIIAKRQPMAKDLREIIAVGKIVAELERAGDEARKIAGLTIRLGETDAASPPGLIAALVSLCDYVIEMLTLSMRAFDHLNLKTAATVIEKGLGLEDRLRLILSTLSECLFKDAKNARHFVDLVLAIRALERFGGHAKNIAGHIVFITDGLDVRHVDDADILQKIKERRGF